jgi:uncharacterized integral membrane protein
MRLIRFLLSYVTVTVAGIVLVAFLALNHTKVQLDVFGPEYSVSLAIVIGGALLLGFVLALLLLLPGHIATTVHAWSLNREVRLLEDEVEDGDERYARWLSQHEHLLQGHERMLHRHQVLVAEYSRMAAERDQAYLQLASARRAQPPLPPMAQPVAADAARHLLPPAAPVLGPDARPAIPVAYDEPAAIPVAYEEPPVDPPTVPSERRHILAAAVLPTATGLEPARVVSTTGAAPTRTGSVERAVPTTDPPTSTRFEPSAGQEARDGESQPRSAPVPLHRWRQRITALRSTAESQLERLKQCSPL